MAILGMSLRRDFPEQYALFSTRSFTFRDRVLNGHNTLMYRYQGVDGIKTGYTDVSGYNLVSSAVINDKHLVGVVLGAGSARQRDDQMAKLLSRSARKTQIPRGNSLQWPSRSLSRSEQLSSSRKLTQ
jgi:D-alanyl-D-alanine carboxypeptidase/D-alanyl-D-alanine carboxypeptidase (penicillin-binding protein 5/6)